MEPVSLSVSVIALATIFDSALNCFKHVRVAKSFGVDYQTYVLRLQNLQLRLSRWGETVGIGKDVTAHEQSTTNSLLESQLKRAEELVGCGRSGGSWTLQTRDGVGARWMRYAGSLPKKGYRSKLTLD